MNAKHHATVVCKVPTCNEKLSGESDESEWGAQQDLRKKAKEAQWLVRVRFISSAMGGGIAGPVRCPVHKEPPKHKKRAHRRWALRMELAKDPWPVALCFRKQLGATTTMVYYDYSALLVGPYVRGVVYEVPDDEAERLVRCKQFKVMAA